jgi:heme/copper-type cytochrome/quinol oxidase subunit 4
VTADKIHRGHAITEQVHADLKHSTLAYLPSKVFTAIAAWLVPAVMVQPHSRAAAMTGPAIAKATTVTIRLKLITARMRPLPAARPYIYRLRAPG